MFFSFNYVFFFLVKIIYFFKLDDDVDFDVTFIIIILLVTLAFDVPIIH